MDGRYKVVWRAGRRSWREIRKLRAGHSIMAQSPVAASLRIILLDDARLGQAKELGERPVRPAGATRQRRGKGRHGRAAVPVERPQVDSPAVRQAGQRARRNQ